MSSKPWHETLSREELIERVEAADRSNERNRNAFNNAMLLNDELKIELAVLEERCKAHSYVQRLERLCRDLHRGLVYALICAEVPLEGKGTYQDMKQRMEELGLFEGSKQ